MDGWTKRALEKRKPQEKSTEIDFWIPQPLFDALDERFGPFTLDAAASKKNAKCEDFFSKHHDALSQDWHGVVWCNPPYGRTTKSSKGTATWIAKAVEEINKNNAKRIAMLIPAYSDLSYFHELILPNVRYIIYVKSRIKFDGPNICEGGTSRHPSAIYIFDKKSKGKIRVGSIYRDESDLTIY